MQVNAPSYGDVDGLVKKATLMIPSKEPPFVSIRNIQLVNNTMYWTNDLVLEAKFTPADATNQTVIWAIKQWKPTSGAALTLPALDPADEASVLAYNTAKTALFAKVRFQQEEYVKDDSVWPNEIGLKPFPDIIYTPAGELSIGTITLYAIVKQGVQNSSGAFSDYKKETITVTVQDPPLFTYKLDGVDKSTKYWGAVDNGGVKGGKMEISTAGTDGKRRGYTITLGGGYGNSHHYFKVELDGDTFNSYVGGGIRCKYNAVEGEGDNNLIGKTVRVKAWTTVPPKTYSNAPYVSSIKIPGDANVFTKDLEFNFFKDDANIFNGGAGADMPSPQTINGKEVLFQPVKEAHVVYVWFVPWCEEKKNGVSTKFTISDVELFKATP